MAQNLVPNTYFLEEAASLARGSILARLDPNLAFQPYFRLDLGLEIPEAKHASWDYCDMAGRFVDALILTAPMVGADRPGEAELGLRAFLLDRANPDDGLFYDAEAPWSTYAADMFCQGRVLLGLVSWFLLTGDPDVESKLDGLIEGLSRIAVWDGDACSYPTDIWIDGQWVNGGLWQGAAPGYAAQQMVGLARYAKATGNPSALKLASGLAHHFVNCGVINPDGTFRGHTHSQGILPSALGVLAYALVAGDRDMASWCGRVYEHARTYTSSFGWLPDGLGFRPEENFFAGTCETCALADLIELAITLTEAGIGDYWDDVERYARNQLLEQQIRDPARAVAPGILAQTATPVERILRGAFDSTAPPNSLLGEQRGRGRRVLHPGGRARLLHGLGPDCHAPAGGRLRQSGDQPGYALGPSYQRRAIPRRPAAGSSAGESVLLAPTGMGRYQFGASDRRWVRAANRASWTISGARSSAARPGGRGDVSARRAGAD